MPIRDATPVLVGVGQYTQHELPSTLAQGIAPSPVDLAAEAGRRALADARANGALVDAIDTVAVVRTFSDSVPRHAHAHGRAQNPPRSVAQRLGLAPRRAIYSEVGGNTPQRYVNQFAEEIAAGRCGAVLLAGAEALATLKHAARLGVTLDWSESVEGDQDDRGFGVAYAGQADLAHQMTAPIHVYPLFEQAIRARRAVSVSAHLRSMARLFAPFARVAADNPYATDRTGYGVEVLATPTGKNRFVVFPYPRRVCARDTVDQAAALLLTSVRRARALGIPSERWVFLHGCADVDDKLLVLERTDYARSPAIRLLGQRALAMAGRNLDDIAHIDLYSCFPCAVEIACRELGLSELDPRGLTLTGGLPYFGGPGNNYSTHAIAEAVARCREQPDSYALVTANGGYLTKHSAGIYSALPVEGAWRREPPSSYQRHIAALDSPKWVASAHGAAAIETCAVAYREGEPNLGLVIARLADGTRVPANVPPEDRTALAALLRDDVVGMSGRIEPQHDRNRFRLS